ncbi:MAG: DNA repair ATPase [Opitutales bacterium]
MTQGKLEGGAYEVIRNRLNQQGKDLLGRLQALDANRKAVFGAVEPRLLTTERIQTANNCIPRGMTALPGDRFIFGYNVHIGLKSQVEVSDVFSLFQYHQDEHHFTQDDLSFLTSSQEFVQDFQYLYKYYKKTTFAKFMRMGPNLYMAFRISEDIRDIKVFKWLLKDDGTFQYLGNRFDHEYQFPEQHGFKWTRAHRDMQRSGTHPHISIEDRLFVETVGGDLTIKIEDNTDSGEGIYSEPVSYADQTLDDADIYYAVVGSLIFLKIKPYQEKQTRYFIYNEKVKDVKRVDSIEHSCVLLPEEHGVIFADGFYLHNGDYKRFDPREEAMLYERTIRAPNGEDYLYVFYQRDQGVYQLMPYNLIAQKVENPIEANGYALFENGSLAYFKAHDEAQKHHTVQVWQTPFSAREIPVEGQKDSYLFKVGNSDIVRCMAECYEIYNLLQREDAYEGLYLDLTRIATRVIDSYFWIENEAAANLKEVLSQILGTGQAAIDEFEKVQRIRKATLDQTRQVQTTARKLFTELDGTQPDDVRGYVDRLARLRRLRGEVIGLRELRYVDTSLCDELETQIAERSDGVARHTVEFLLQPEALQPYRDAIAAQRGEIDSAKTAQEAKQILEELDQIGEQLEMLIETISNLKIEDATQTTRIIDSVSELFTELNQLKGAARNKRLDLMRAEGAAQFHAQLKLLEQSVANYLDIADTPEAVDEYLTKMMVQLEELEGTYAEFDEFIETLSNKRAELYDAFETKKAALMEARNRRATKLVSSAERILKGIENRARSMTEIAEINGYFAADLMVDKTRDLVSQLKEIGEAIKGDDLLTRLKTIQGDAIRQLKDRQELFVDGENVIKFGKHRFTVNTQPLELTTVLREGELFYHLSGTQFFERVVDDRLEATREVWEMQSPAENAQVYRAEFLAYQMLKALEGGLEPGLAGFVQLDGEARLEAVRRFMAPRYADGYTKGVHDADAERLLTALAKIHQSVGLLRYSPDARACALAFWVSSSGDNGLAAHLRERLEAFGAMLRAYPEHKTQRVYINELRSAITRFNDAHGLFPNNLANEAAEYLFYEIVEDEHFYITRESAKLADDFKHELLERRFLEKFDAARERVKGDAVSEFRIIRDWLEGHAAHHKLPQEQHEFIAEAAAHILRGGVERRRIIDVPIQVDLEDLRGDHDNIAEGGKYHMNYLHFMDRLRAFEAGPFTLYHQFQERKQELVEQFAEELRLGEFKPRVLSAFVRNKLLDTVYLPLIGDNLAKQIGAAGADARTDRMGLLLLISPPGYGKTTLMEYVANRLGITFMNVNGPSLGHDVTSLDPGQCANMAARQEVEKINLAFEMGDNVLIYLDDIQHTNPELLQKFISLCDGTRRIEGVYKGKSKTYDLRGRKVAVVMAGNPYTETGGKFQIPDMLANRADTYNLGDIIGENSDAFEASYIENSLTSNSVLSRLSSRSRKDVYAIMQIARTGQREGVEFDSSFSMEEVNEMVSVMKKLMRVRDTILRVNLMYVRSAAQADDYRTEPPFKLQGSYRNMNRLAEKVLPIMTDREIEQLIDDHYAGESQTLTDGAEANLLKFKELEGKLTPDETERWEEIKKRFKRQKALGGAGDTDPVNRVVAQLADFNNGLAELGDTLNEGTKTYGATMAEALAGLREALMEGSRSQQHTLAEALDSLSGSLMAGSQRTGESLAGLVESLRETMAAEAARGREGQAELSARLDVIAERWLQHSTETASAQNLASERNLSAITPILSQMAEGLAATSQAHRESSVQTAEAITPLLNRLVDKLDAASDAQREAAAQTVEALVPLLGRVADNLSTSSEAQREGAQASAERAGKFLSTIADSIREGQLAAAEQTSGVLGMMTPLLGNISNQLARIAETGAAGGRQSETMEQILATLARAETEQTKAVQAWAEDMAQRDSAPEARTAPLPMPAQEATAAHASGGALKLDTRTEALLQSILIAFHHLFRKTGIERPQVFTSDETE